MSFALEDLCDFETGARKGGVDVVRRRGDVCDFGDHHNIAFVHLLRKRQIQRGAEWAVVSWHQRCKARQEQQRANEGGCDLCGYVSFKHRGLFRVGVWFCAMSFVYLPSDLETSVR